MLFPFDNQSFLVISRKQMSHYQYGRPYVVISIADPDSSIPVVPQGEGLLDVLRLRFYDIEEPVSVANSGEALSSISDFQVRQIVRFVERWREEGVLFVVHCDDGISRSAAVAAAISKCLNNDDNAFFLHLNPNRFVFRKVLSAMLNQEVPEHLADEGPVEW